MNFAVLYSWSDTARDNNTGNLQLRVRAKPCSTLGGTVTSRALESSTHGVVLVSYHTVRGHCLAMVKFIVEVPNIEMGWAALSLQQCGGAWGASLRWAEGIADDDVNHDV